MTFTTSKTKKVCPYQVLSKNIGCHPWTLFNVVQYIIKNIYRCFLKEIAAPTSVTAFLPAICLAVPERDSQSC